MNKLLGKASILFVEYIVKKTPMELILHRNFLIVGFNFVEQCAHDFRQVSDRISGSTLRLCLEWN